jgi:hypothetical protein
MKRALFLSGLGVGYVLGARAGRERYEQLARVGRGVQERPEFQQVTALLAAKASRVARGPR